MSETEFIVIEDEEAADIRAKAESNGWIDALAAGKMIRMAVIPRLGSGVKKRTGKNARLKSLPAPDGGFYLWLEFLEAPDA